MADRRRAAAPFLALGIVFLAIGLRNRAFLALGIVFLALGIAGARR